MGRRAAAAIAFVLLAAAAVTVWLALDADEPRPQYDLVVRDSAAAAAEAAGIDLEALVRDAANEAVARLPKLPRVTIEVKVDPGEAIPETGVGGFIDSSGDVHLFVERRLRQGSELWLRALVAHELHHAARLGHRRLYGSLLEAFVTEGLADRFSREVFPEVPVPPWSDALSAAQAAELWRRAKAVPEGEPYERDAWLFGGSELPRWTGYTLGYRIVGAYLERAGRTAAEAFDVDAETVIAAYEK